MTASARRERQLGWTTKNQQRFPDITADTIDEAIANQLCPICGAGPFIVMAGHVAKKHGITRFEFRDMLGVDYHVSICDPAHSAARSALSKELYEEGRTGIRKSTKGHKKVRRSFAWYSSQRDKALQVSDAVRRAQGRKTSELRLAAVAERDARILERLDLGETYAQVAAAEGVNSVTVRTVANRNGRDEDGRARYHKSRRGKDDASLQAGRAARQASVEAMWARRIDRLNSGESVAEIAASEGMGAKQLAYSLRQRGVSVPDGRRNRVVVTDTFNCAWCGTEVTRPRSDQNSTKSGNRFCTVSHAAKWRCAQNAQSDGSSAERCGD